MKPPACNTYHREISGDMEPDPERYQYRQPSAGEPDVCDLICTGQRLKEQFGPDHCYSTDSVVAGLRRREGDYPEGTYTTWTIYVQQWWRVDKWIKKGLPGALPDPGHKSEVVASGGHLCRLYAHDDSQFTIGEMAPPEIVRALKIANEKRRGSKAQRSLFA